jgi:Ser/Thr protein kinase RdoA (MazF antagonist)
MAQMHELAAQWQPPVGLNKRRWDGGGLFREVEGTDLTAGELWPLLPRRYQKPFGAIAEQVQQVMDAWGTGPHVYGLIHADLGIDANLLFWRGEARAIDFDDSGFGYWMYDLAVSLEHVRDSEEYLCLRDALLDGYAELRTLPDEQLARLELFLAAWYVYVSLWCVAMAKVHPGYQDELFERMERAAGLAVRYAESS